MPWFVCMYMWNLFLAKHGFQSCVVHGTMAQSGAQTINFEPKQSTLFFKAPMSLSIEEEVEQPTCLSIEEEEAIGT